MNYGAQAFEIRRVEEGPGTVTDQRAYEQARQTYCVRYGLPYVAPVWPQRRIAS